jgi:hypothetical protein
MGTREDCTMPQGKATCYNLSYKQGVKEGGDKGKPSFGLSIAKCVPKNTFGVTFGF